MQNQITFSIMESLALWGAQLKEIQKKKQGKRAPALLELMVPTPPSPDSKGHGHSANLSACHHRLIGPNSLWQVHMLPSTRCRWLKRSSNTNCCFQRKWSHSLGTGPMLGPQWQRKQTGGQPSRIRGTLGDLELKGLDCSDSSHTCKLGASD